MSWTDFYPVLEDLQISEYEQLASAAERAELDNWFAVERRINERPAQHRVSVSLFWKNLSAEEGELKVISRKQMKNAANLGLVSRYPPWEHYVKPLLKGAVLLRTQRPEVVLRVYLASDLEFLIKDLVAVGCEVFMMRSPSLRHNPGAMWRFLALEEPGEWVTLIDADRAADILADVERSEQTMKAGLGFWRMPYFFNMGRGNDVGNYRPINACQFGAQGGHPLALLMRAFIWHSRRGTLRTTWLEIAHIGEKPHPFAATIWPSYGFDEWFLLVGLYPRLAFEGALTFFHWSLPVLDFCHTLDVEYVTWANPSSEVFRCARPVVVGSPPWERTPTETVLAVREETTVFVRERSKAGPAHDIFWRVPAKEIQAFPPFAGSLTELLCSVREHLSAPFWVDLNPRLQLGNRGGELFLDRRYADADVVVCGQSFVLMSPEIVAWAKEMGLKGIQWQENGILKFPKLEGPMTLWRTAFSNEFYRELANSRICLDPGVLLQAWIDLGRAKVIITTAKQMGWSVR